MTDTTRKSISDDSNRSAKNNITQQANGQNQISNRDQYFNNKNLPPFQIQHTTTNRTPKEAKEMSKWFESEEAAKLRDAIAESLIPDEVKRLIRSYVPRWNHYIKLIGEVTRGMLPGKVALTRVYPVTCPNFIASFRNYPRVKYEAVYRMAGRVTYFKATQYERMIGEVASLCRYIGPRKLEDPEDWQATVNTWRFNWR